MKIDGPIKGVAFPRGKEVKSGKARSQDDRSTASTVSDEVQLTDNSARIRELEAQLAEIEVTDPGKVEAIRQAIADGTFKVDEEAVAEGLVQESLENIAHQAKR